MPAARTAVWGAVAALAFLVAALAYRIVEPRAPGLLILLAVAVPVGLAGALGARAAAR